MTGKIALHKRYFSRYLMLLCVVLGRSYTVQEIRNLARRRQVGKTIESRVSRLVDLFVEHGDNNCLGIQGDDAVVIGLVFITRRRRLYTASTETACCSTGHTTPTQLASTLVGLIFLRERVIFCIHSFFSQIGELMVTAADGKGMSVCEMLIQDQRKDSMRECLEFFKSVMGEEKTESFVIDKDFTEWSVLQEVFPPSEVRFLHPLCDSSSYYCSFYVNE